MDTLITSAQQDLCENSWLNGYWFFIKN